MKAIILYTLLIISVTVQSVEAGFRASAELGKDVDSDVCYTELSVGYIFKPLPYLTVYPYGKQLTWFEQSGNPVSGGAPFRDVYNIGAEIKWHNIVIGANHYCSHAVYTSDNWSKYNKPVNNTQLTRVFVRYEFNK